jgi:hypothetical protein
MKAITTKYLGPTTYKGARIVAFDGDKNRRYFPYPHELSAEAAHTKCAYLFQTAMRWPNASLATGWQSGATYVHVVRG